MQATGPNAEQITYWNETAGPKWVALEAMLDTQIRPLGDAVLELIAIQPGERVLDVGCGTGQTTLDWLAVPMMAAAQHVALQPPPAPGAPGPFAFADADRVRAILEGAGFADVHLTDHRITLTVGGDGPLDRAVDFLLQMGPTAALLREADETVRATVAAAVRDALAPHHTPAGVRMAAAAWLVTGRA